VRADVMLCSVTTHQQEQTIMSKKKSAKPSKPKAVAKVAKVVRAVPAKVEREVRNGIPRPAAETICGKVWAFLDAARAKGGTPAATDVIEGIKDINEATARTQTQRYKKFHA
jgi:hypothetical protein